LQSNNAVVNFSGYVPCAGGETLFFTYYIHSDGSYLETTNASVAFQRVDGSTYALNLSGAPYNSVRSADQCVGGLTVMVPFTVPDDAVGVLPYVERPSFTGFTFFVNRARLTRAAVGADITKDQPIVSLLDETTGRASGDFIDVNGRLFAKLVGASQARDGDVVDLSSLGLPSTPKIAFLPGGNSGAAGQNLLIVADGLTPTGFTMRAKSQAVVAGSLITDASPSSGGGGDPQFVINRSNSGAPFDGKFVFRISVNIVFIGPFQVDVMYATFYVKKSGVWVEVASEGYGGTGPYDVITTPGVVDFGSGSEFGVTFASVYGSSTATFQNVKYQLGTVSETSLTPAGASAIPFLVLLQ
jgi:hypothetical protein